MIYLGPYVWRNNRWMPPVGTLGAIDLRPRPAQAERARVNGNGLFYTRTRLNSDYRQFSAGSLYDVVPTEGERAIFTAMLGVPVVDGSTLIEWLWTALGLYADPSGERSAKPLMPTSHGELELWLGGHSKVMSRRFMLSAAEARPCIEVRKRDYRAMRSACLDGRTTDSELYLKQLGAWGLELGISNPQDYFVPSDLPRLSPIAPTTVIIDDFTRADGAAIGNQLTWTKVSGTWNTASNQLDCGGTGSVRAESDLSDANHYAQAKCVNYTNGNDMFEGAACRFDSAAETFYMSFLYCFDNTEQIYKVVSGTLSSLQSTSVTFAANDVCKVQASGSTIKGFQNGTERLSLTDTAITTGTRTGLRGYRGEALDPRFDDFEAGDVAAGGVFGSNFYRQVAGLGG